MSLAKFLKEVEGEVKDQAGYHIPYKDIAGYWTIGYGHKILPHETFHRIDDETAMLLYEKDARKAKQAVCTYVDIELNLNQRNALVSFVYNVGVSAFKRSTALKYLNKKDFEKFAFHLGDREKGWTKYTDPKTGEKKISEGLYKRRQKELELFFSEPNTYC